MNGWSNKITFRWEITSIAILTFLLTKFFHTESECVAHHEVDEYIHFEYQTTLIHSTNDPNA